jgi:Zn-dependent metalloprotease
VIVALLLAATSAASFKTDFPRAKAEASPDGALVAASGFTARGLGDTPEAAARAFLDRYGRDFGVLPEQKLVLRGAVAKTSGHTLRFERQLSGDPIFGADVEVTVNDANSVMRVLTTEVPEQAEGTFKLTKEQAIVAATQSQTDLARDSRPRAARGWMSTGALLKPVWRVDLIAGNPRTDWRSFMDAESGTLLGRVDVGPPRKPTKRDLAN